MSRKRRLKDPLARLVAEACGWTIDSDGGVKMTDSQNDDYTFVDEDLFTDCVRQIADAVRHHDQHLWVPDHLHPPTEAT